MIIPIGSPDSQQLHFIRMVNGQPVSSLRELVRFVPLVPDRDLTTETSQERKGNSGG
jgi:hypothetical protein